MNFNHVRLCSRLLLVAALLAPRPAQAQNKKLGIMNADGSHVRTLIDMPGYFWQGSPHFSHDGKRIAFDGTVNELFQNDHIFVIDVAGGEPRDLGLGSQPSWSSDDKQICFFMLDGNSNNELPGVYVMNADGKSRQFLTPGAFPRWSPDGGRIAYLNDRDGVTSIWIYSILDSETKPLLSDKVAAVSPPAWSPDSHQIAFLGRRKPEDDRELCLVQTEGDNDLKTLCKDHVSSIAPCWSPGSKILFVARPPGGSTLFARPCKPRQVDADRLRREQLP